jgi:hypothetical protein
MEDYMTQESIKRSDNLYQEMLKDQNSKAINEVLDKWFENWGGANDSETVRHWTDAHKNHYVARSVFVFAIEHAEEILAEIKKAGN